MTIKDGGPAFPISYECEVLESVSYQSEPVKTRVTIRNDGMTLRDYFAAKAMQALITAAWSNPSPAQTRYREWASDQAPDTNPTFYDWVASVSKEHADSMLRAREPQP